MEQEEMRYRKLNSLEELKHIEPFREIVLIREHENDADIQLLLISSDGTDYIYGISRLGRDAITESIYNLQFASCIEGGVRYVDERYVETFFKIPRDSRDFKFTIYDKLLKDRGI